LSLLPISSHPLALADIIISRNSASIHASPDFNDDEDFIRRMDHYRKGYETLQETEGSYIKRYDSGDRIHLHGIHGFIRTKISSFVMNIHTAPRTIYLVRSGETEFIRKGMIGGGMPPRLSPFLTMRSDSPLTDEGVEFSNALSHFFETDETGFSVSPDKLVVWSSPQLASLTAKKIKSSRYVEWRALRNIESGVCDGLTYDQIRTKYPREYKARQSDKLRYRYPQGESYVDLITRLEPVIFEVPL
jgi:broad specificity phosphatase PhoE